MQEGDEDETGVIWDDSEGTRKIKAAPVEKIVQLITSANPGKTSPVIFWLYNAY